MQETMGPHENSTCDFTTRMPVLGRMFDVIEIRPDGTSLLGSSNLTSRYWTGNLSICNSPEDLGIALKCRSFLDFDGGLSCAKFLTDDKIVVGLDSGYIPLLNFDSELGSVPVITASVWEHDDVVTSLCVCQNGTKFVTGSMDRSIKVWNTEYFVCSDTYRPAHIDTVLDIAVHPENDNIVVSCSEDGAVTLWDLRLMKPALAIRRQYVGRPTCVAFRRRGQADLVVGTVCGNIATMSLSMVSDTSNSLPGLELGVHSHPVKSVSVAPHNDTHIASCADENKVVVSVAEEAHPKIIYSDKRHNDFVRALAWSTDGQQLFSCGWDHQVLLHDLTVSTEA